MILNSLNFDEVTVDDRLFWWKHVWRVILISRNVMWLRNDYNSAIVTQLTREEFEQSELEYYTGQDQEIIKVGRDEPEKGNSSGELRRGNVSSGIRERERTDPLLSIPVQGKADRKGISVRATSKGVKV